MNTFEKFHFAEQAERLFADIYGALAKQCEHEPTHHALFSRLEQEEIQHAMRINMLRKRYVAMGRDMKAIKLDIAPLQILLKQGEMLKQRLESGELSGNIPEIVAIIAELERKFAGVHAEMISETADASLRTFFEKLAAQDRGHASLLSQ